jgi:hypothetical protein
MSDSIRFFRFAPWRLSEPGAEVDAWVAASVPRGITLEQCYISRRRDAEVLNVRYINTLQELGRCRLQRDEGSTLLANLVNEGNAAILWKQGGEADRYEEERSNEAEFLAHKQEAVHAARTLASLFRNQSSLADWTASMAFVKGMKQMPAGGSISRKNEIVPTPFLSWRVPTLVDGGTPRTADYLVELMERLAEESQAAISGGYHTRRYGPFLYPSGTTPPRKSNDLFVNGLLYVAARGARQATGETSKFEVGEQMPKDGRPLYSLTSTFIKDVTSAAHPSGLPTEISQDDAKNRLKKLLSRNPGLICRGWSADWGDR